MNDELRLIWGKYFSNRANRLRQEVEDLDELLNELGKPFTEEPNYDKLNYIPKKGSKADYEQARYEDQQDKNLFKTLQEKLREHKGFWENTTYKYWFHSRDESLIDRRKK